MTLFEVEGNNVSNLIGQSVGNKSAAPVATVSKNGHASTEGSIAAVYGLSCEAIRRKLNFCLVIAGISAESDYAQHLFF